MDKKENKIEKAVTDNKLNNRFWLTKKTTYSLLAILACVLLIVVLSFTNATFNEENIKSIKYWVNFAILMAICIFGMIIGQQVGDDISRNNPKGQFRKSLTNYANSYQKVEAKKIFCYFDDWLVIYKEKKLQKKKENYLKNNGIHQMEVLNLDLNELNNLKNPYKKEWADGTTTYFLSCTDEQIQVIKNCLSGKIKVNDLSKSFFVDAFNSISKDMWESAAKSEKKKGLYISANYIYKLLALLAFTLLSSGLEPSSVGQGGYSVIILQMAHRLYTLTMSVIFGTYVGFKMVSMDIQYLDFKTSILNQFYEENDLKIYNHLSLEQKAQKEYEESQKTKEEVISNDGETSILD
jgi:hypothetical protein